MANNNKSYRIRTNVGKEADTFLNVHLDQEYDSLEILSLKISDKDTYKLHNSDYGVIVGRVLANGNFGVPNAKISVFIAADERNSSLDMWNLYPYTSTSTKNDKNIRYNLLPDESVKDCHKAVGTFPNKTFLLENDATLEVFDKYYLYTTRTNTAGDYLICGVPTGTQTLHMDLDLSDCGILSQRPRDFVYKGYTIEQFENPNQFKKDENIDGLSQIFSQNQPVYVQPFWGNTDNGEEIGITRADIEIAFKFEPTCVFMGSAISDNASNGVGKKCVPTNQMGAMDELTAGEGTIEMIRKTPGGSVEEFSVKGNQVINGNGVWCYQIPMNLDYMMTDEYGNMVPTDDPEKGIPTRTRVRFRASLTDMENSTQSYYRAKYLIPNNPTIESEKVDYNFGTYTDEDSYRDLFWNGVYTVKSYIPRFQKSKRWKNERFSGIKACNYYGGNNPMPYNNLRIKLPFMFTVLCIFVKLFIKIATLINRIQYVIWRVLFQIPIANARRNAEQGGAHCVYIGDGLCPDMEGWYFAPACMDGSFKGGMRPRKWQEIKNIIIRNTLAAAKGNGDAPGIDSKDDIKSSQYIDETSIDIQNTTTNEEETVCLTRNVDYLVNCFEMNLAQEYRVIKFDFYNDWVNGVLYFPRWLRKIKRKKKYKFSLDGISTYYKDKVQGCMNAENSTVKKTRYYTQQCSLSYTGKSNEPWTKVTTAIACNGTNNKKNSSVIPARCHKKRGMEQSSIFGKKSGLVTEETTMLGQYVYYLKPCEWKDGDNGRVRTLLFATDIVLLGTLNDCDENGVPQAFKYLNSTSYIMPTNLALTTMDDDPYIYSDKGGTICLSSSDKISTSSFSEGKLKDSARRITPNYETTRNAYVKTEDDKITYDENDDPIAITEAAGINWNYSGPGQDDVDAGLLEKPDDLVKRLFGKNTRYEALYYPGGHFLGLSCVNSETNIKSCVNLKRICEMGATMSQRREEIRGYINQDGTAIPQYRYYVPTGLISNVDIEGASFRSMFATMNHNTLVATKTNENTGYKYYDFRFLRPDGFDGALIDYVHKSSSPYNRQVNHDAINSVTDDSEFFRQVFPTWQFPDDYDPEETNYTETRTIEDTVNDYHMFRFGLNGFTDKEQKKHYLRKTDDGYSMPQYENSFYFYFGLKDGATALDEFKKQFFSQCETNNVTKMPSLTIVEKIDENLEGDATLLIDNMVGPYTITATDNTVNPDEEITYGTDNDIVKLAKEIFGTLTIGHEYTIIVTDSLDHTATKTFVFGSNAVKVDIDIIHFRYDRSEPGRQRIDDLKYGGYIKIADTVKVLGTEYEIRDPENQISFKANTRFLNESMAYSGVSGEIWHIYPIETTGNYDIYFTYKGSDYVVISSIQLEDNSNVEVSVACDYLGYKTGRGLSAITEDQWFNGSVFTGNSINSWLFRHTYYRQTEDDGIGYDSYIYTNTKGGNIAVFGWPEQGGLTSEADLMRETYYKGDYGSYEGYSIDDGWSFIPTMYWDPNTKQMDEMTQTHGSGRNPFDTMVYTDDGRAASNATKIEITDIQQAIGADTLYLTGTCTGTIPTGISKTHGCIVILEDGTALFPIVKNINGSTIVMECYNTTNPYAEITDTDQLSKLLKLATVYPTLRVPVIYKPFYAEVTAATWNLAGITLETNDDNITSAKKVALPMSYKVEGCLHNGLTYNNHFYSGETVTGDEIQTYETFLVDETKRDFYDALTTPTTGDSNYNRQFNFGSGVFNGYGREVTDYDEETEDTIENISYTITEGFPEIPDTDPNHDTVFTGRYENGFDTEILSDSCDIGNSFHTNLRIYTFTTAGTNGECCFIADSIPDTSTEIYITKAANIFNDGGAISTGELFQASYYCGYYNSNATYDIKGAYVTVKKTLLGFSFELTNSSGVKRRETASGESDLYNRGVTLLHKFTLSNSYKNNASQIENLLTGANTIPMSATTIINGTPKGTPVNVGDDPPTTGGTYYTEFNGGLSQYTAIIEKYTREDGLNRNKMTVYKLYPIGQLDVMYPPGDGNEEITP